MKPLRSILVLLAAVLAAGCSPSVPVAREKGALPAMEPDYAGALVPANIAPLNFCITDEADAYVTVLGGSLVLKGKEVRIPLAKWRGLLTASRGGAVSVVVYEKHGRGWTSAEPFNIY